MIAAAAAGLAAAGLAVGVTGLGNYPAMAGIVALFFLAVAAPTALFARVSPALVPLAVLIFIVFGLLVSGGPSGLASFGPGFLRALDPGLPLGIAASALRNTVYFHGYDTAGPLWVLAAWAGGGVAALALVATMRRGPAASSRSPRRADPAPRPSPGTRPHRRTLRPRRSVSSSASTTPGPARHALERAVALLGTRPGALHAVYVDHAAGSDLSGFGHEEMAEARREAAGDVEALVAATATRQASPGPSSAGTDHRPTRSSPRPRTGRPDRHRHRGRPGRSCRPTPHRLGAGPAAAPLALPGAGHPLTCPARRHFLLGTLTSTLFAVADISEAWVATTTGAAATSVDPLPTCPRLLTPQA